MHKIENGRMQKRMMEFKPLGKLPHFFLRNSGGQSKLGGNKSFEGNGGGGSVAQRMRNHSVGG